MARVIAKYKPAKIIPQFVLFALYTRYNWRDLSLRRNFGGGAKRKCNSGKSMSRRGGGGLSVPTVLSSPSPRPLSPSLFPLSSDVYRVKLPSRYSSNFRSDEAARNCNDVFGRLTYRLGNLFIRIARRAPGEMYGIVGNLQTPPTRNENFRRLRPARR